MALAKKDHLVGLDIGSQSIKIAEIEHGKSGRILKNLGIVEISPDLMEDEAIKDIQGVVDLIKKLFKQLKIKEKKVAFSVGGYSIIVKRINVQTMTEEKLLETIHYEAEQYIPFDINDVNLDFQILGEHENNKNQMNVLLVAAKKDLIDQYIDLVEVAAVAYLVDQLRRDVSRALAGGLGQPHGDVTGKVAMTGVARALDSGRDRQVGSGFGKLRQLRQRRLENVSND